MGILNLCYDGTSFECIVYLVTTRLIPLAIKIKPPILIP